jgi:hypothetical protein
MARTGYSITLLLWCLYCTRQTRKWIFITIVYKYTCLLHSDTLNNSLQVYMMLHSDTLNNSLQVYMMLHSDTLNNSLQVYMLLHSDTLNNSLQVYMMLHSDTLSWFWDNQVFVLTPYYLRGEERNTNFLVFLFDITTDLSNDP